MKGPRPQQWGAGQIGGNIFSEMYIVKHIREVAVIESLPWRLMPRKSDHVVDGDFPIDILRCSSYFDIVRLITQREGLLP